MPLRRPRTGPTFSMATGPPASPPTVLEIWWLRTKNCSADRSANWFLPSATPVHGGPLLWPRVFSDLAEGRGRVAVTVSGVRGDSGIPHAIPFMTATGEGRTRFLTAWAAGNEYHASRNVSIGPVSPIISWQGPLPTTSATGFDHRELLPPFSPAGPGEDSLFGLMLGKCTPDTYIGYVPATLLHAPAVPRKYGPLPDRSGLMRFWVLH
jgi:hypothetical protein